MGQGDVVATWKVPLSDGIHKVEFQHGTASGKRVIIIDDKVSWNLAGYQESKLGYRQSFAVTSHQGVQVYISEQRTTSMYP